jgi:quercetin dioxygenase-like cupin family protein
MKIIPKSKSIFVKRPDNSKINYYIFDEYEVHSGEIAPGVKQPWHSHEIINETLLILEGKIELHFLEKDKKKKKVVVVGDLIQVENTPHTFINPFDEVCKMVAFRFIPKGEKKHEVIKNDKTLYPELD